MTRWYEAGTPAEFVRLTAIARQALEERGVPPARVRDHFLIGGDGSRRATIMVSREPFPNADRAAFAAALEADAREPGGAGIRSLYAPGRGDSDPLLAGVVESPSLGDYLARLPYDASPTTDNRPFFFYYIRPGDLDSAFRTNARGQINNVGVVLLVISLGFSLLATLAFVIAPLLAFRRGVLAEDRRKKLRVIAYFACLGLGFILVELGFMQQFVLFLGHPVYALAVVLAGLLIASGLGAGLSARLDARFGERTSRPDHAGHAGGGALALRPVPVAAVRGADRARAAAADRDRRRPRRAARPRHGDVRARGRAGRQHPRPRARRVGLGDQRRDVGRRLGARGHAVDERRLHARACSPASPSTCSATSRCRLLAPPRLREPRGSRCPC